ncbi:restriction endonuclease [Labilibaculum manganireducens]|uniref:Restriction endonuclease n=1 Tax=Labilibaculum manganireducens TaxID=1940525 RepID=A0A2N3I7H9_9BACT|nr:HpaII family restriction endonuclease [Labilibaculum manganireducens]PKQ66284.1 restriction endonuclease [Labilibaculum manganireducens]
MLRGNKGEWSELYTLFKILGDKIVHPGDEGLNRIPDIIYPLIKVLRSENDGDFEYLINQDLVIVSSNRKELVRIPVVEFAQKAKVLLQEIKNNDKTFAVCEIEEFMDKIHCCSLKASSSAKTDITIVIHDERTQQTPILGFSIKSQLGNPSTLLNAGKSTNFIYKISGLDSSEELINDINSIATRSKIRDRLNRILDLGGEFKFLNTERVVFSNNLVLIDSMLPQIVSEMVLQFYSNGISSVRELVQVVEGVNPVKFDQSHNHQFYSYKIKRFLTDVALGMMPATVWTGQYDATGGYLVVKEDGDVLCYHVYNKNEFENYLLNHTKLDTASSTRHEFGQIYEEAGEVFMKLNLQIRFVK